MLPQVTQFVKMLPTIMKHNSPVILTSLAAVGTLGTAVLSAKAGFKIGREFQYYNDSLSEDDRSIKDLVKENWKQVAQPAVAGTVTIAALIGATRAGSRQAAALATAYTLSEKAFEEYKGKVVEQIGANKEVKIRDAVVQDRVTHNAGDKEIVVDMDSDVPAYDVLSGRFFSTTYEGIRKAQNDFNEKLLHDGYGSLNEFWDLIGLTGTEIGDNLGWTSDRLVEVHITTTTMGENKKPCLALGFADNPQVNFWKFH